MARKQTNSDTQDWTLTAQQQAVVDLLVTGHNVTDTAQALDLERPTVSKWIHHHPGFQAEMNLRRKELWGELSQKLTSLIPRAMTVIEAELDGDDRLSAAIHVLKAAGFYGLVMPAGETRAEVLAAKQALFDYERQRATDEVEMSIAERTEADVLRRLAHTPFMPNRSK